MATKINTDYYGAENTWNNYTGYHASNVKYVANNKTIWNLKKDSVYTGGTLDMSASPWGIGESSLSSNFIGLNYRTADNRIKIMKNFSTKKNSPLLLFEGGGFHSASDWQGGETSPNSYLSQGSIKERLSPYIECTNTFPQTKSTLEIDENTEYQRMFAYEGQTITSWDYQKSRLMVDVVWWRNKTTGAVSHDWLARFISENSYRTATEDIEILGVTMFLGWQWGNPGDHPTGNESDSALIPTIDGVEIDTPEIYKQIYYGDDVTKYTPFYKKLLTLGYWRISSRWSTSSIDSTSSLGSYTDYGEPHATPYFGLTSLMFGNVSEKRQVFDDVSYHWEIRYAWNSANNTGSNAINLTDGDIAPNTGYYLPYCALVIDEHIYDDIYQASYYALIHEACFMGLPVIANRYDYPYSIGANDWVFLPKFDEHLVTTGEFTRGADTQNEPNYLWSNIFDDNMPEYDPEYQPPEPEPEENDYGDVENLGSARGLFPAGVNIYLMSRLDYNTFMGELNSYYANSTPDDWTLDFQGVNPSDYILNVYYTPYNFVKSDTKSNVKIGQITLTTEAYELSQGSPGVDDPNKWKYFSYGTRKVTPLYNDFRDYDPYTKVELYLPLAGTVDLDTNYVMNHNITVEYYFDLMTMSGVAAVYRDSMLYKTSDFKLGAQVPLLITNMGQIQNQITQLEFSQKQNNLRLATSAISSGVSIASIVAGGEATTAQAVGAGGGAFSLASGIMKADEIDYQLKHTSPSVSVTGAAEPLNNYSVGQLTPKLIIKRPLMLNTLDNAIYSKTIGNSCCINTTLDTMNGLVVCSSVDTTGIQKEISTGVYISPTIDEVNMIKSTFGSGVIL